MLDLLFRGGAFPPHLVTPVARSSSPNTLSEGVLAWARNSGAGLCVRLDGLTHLSAKKQIVEDLVSQSRIPLSMIDVIADAQDLPRAYSHEDLASALPAGQQSRTWAVLAGTFPGR